MKRLLGLRIAILRSKVLAPDSGDPALSSLAPICPSDVPVSYANRPRKVSSIATLGTEDTWLRKTLFDALSQNRSHNSHTPRFSIVFPTAEDIRRTIDGYGAGGSIHMKIQSAQQARQLQYLRPMLCHWAGDGARTSPHNPQTDRDNPRTGLHTEHNTPDRAQTVGISAGPPVREAGRRRAGPHIKTYFRFTDDSAAKMDWAMTTSANLSKQAWGAAPNASGEVRICSYELGVVVWPALWEEGPAAGGEKGVAAEMVPVFKRDTVTVQDESEPVGLKAGPPPLQVGLRMPYDLPLVPYPADDEPWCATKSHDAPDWMGRSWHVA